MGQLTFCKSKDSAEGKNSSVKVGLTFTPEKNVKEFLTDVMSSVFDKTSGTVLDSEDGLFSVVVKTEQKETIKKDGFCMSKKTKFQKRGSFVFKSEAYRELLIWFKELKKKNEWPS